MTTQAERWLLEFDRECADRLQSAYGTYVAAWRCYRDGLTPAEAVEMILAGIEGVTKRCAWFSTTAEG